MSRRSLFAVLATLAIAGLTLIAIFGPAGDRNRRHSDIEVVQVVDDQGQPISGANTIIIERGGPGFFPFGIFFLPLGILFFLGVLRFFGGGRHGGGPGPWGGDREAWLNDWHRRQHEPDATTSAGGSTTA